MVEFYHVTSKNASLTTKNFTNSLTFTHFDGQGCTKEQPLHMTFTEKTPLPDRRQGKENRMEWLVSNQGNALPLSEYIRRCVDDVPQRVIR